MYVNFCLPCMSVLIHLFIRDFLFVIHFFWSPEFTSKMSMWLKEYEMWRHSFFCYFWYFAYDCSMVFMSSDSCSLIVDLGTVDCRPCVCVCMTLFCYKVWKDACQECVKIRICCKWQKENVSYRYCSLTYCQKQFCLHCAIFIVRIYFWIGRTLWGSQWL